MKSLTNSPHKNKPSGLCSLEMCCIDQKVHFSTVAKSCISLAVWMAMCVHTHRVWVNPAHPLTTDPSVRGSPCIMSCMFLVCFPAGTKHACRKKWCKTINYTSKCYIAQLFGWLLRQAWKGFLWYWYIVLEVLLLLTTNVTTTTTVAQMLKCQKKWCRSKRKSRRKF